MKSFFISLITILIIFSVVETTFAQWSKTGSNIYINPYVNGDKVGIGTSSPTSDLHLLNGAGPTLTFTTGTPISGTTLGSIVGKGFYTSSQMEGAKIEMNGDGTWNYNTYPGRISFWTRPSTLSGALTERMRIDNQGNVGIGTTPGTGVRLNVLGGKVLFGATSTQISSTTNLEVVNGSIISVSAATNASFLSLNHNGVISANRTGTGTYQPIIFQTSNTERLRILANGNVGIGTTSPIYKLHVNGNLGVESGNEFHLTGGAYLKGYSGGGNMEGMSFYSYDGEQSVLGIYLVGTGKVAIGKTISPNSDYHLDVNGKIRANEVVVNTTGADFVFQENYNLLNLTEVETFIKENKHLPEIPNAEEMQQNGMSLSEMNTKLLQKVEELTLYIIDQEKRIKNLEDKNEK